VSSAVQSNQEASRDSGRNDRAVHTDADGAVRVAGTRVTLDTIVAAFDAGATAEEIAQHYSSISLADVYSVIATTCGTRTKFPFSFTGVRNRRQPFEKRSSGVSPFGHTGTTDRQGQ
jgi:uncharacterized protein (DUF433 family)